MRSWIYLIPFLLVLGSCNQNLEVVRDGESLSDAQKTAPSANAKPLALPGGERGKVPPFVKAFFMHQFVESLYGTPKNFNPNPKWTSPLKDPEKGRVWCTDCHLSGQVNFANIPKQRMPMNEELERDKEFMTDLMKKWVARLNSDEYHAKAKLKEPVTCLTCHETDPSAK
jgi:hypothetical protein